MGAGDGGNSDGSGGDGSNKAAGHPRDKITVPSRAELLDFLGSAEFERDYFEKAPVLITLADGRWEHASEESEPFTLSTLLALPRWSYEAVGPKDGHHRSLVFRGGSFVPSDAAPGWKRGDSVKRADIVDALQREQTVIAHGAQLFHPAVAKITLKMSEIFHRIVNTNIYITAASKKPTDPDKPPVASMAAHNDIQCTLIVQVQGRKRWRLWPLPQFMLARSDRETLGKTPKRVLDETKLGSPRMDVVIEPGQVLYVPRGVVHATSTANLQQDDRDHRLDDVSGSSTSMHLTIGLEAGFGWTVEGFLGAGKGVMAASANVNSGNRESLRLVLHCDCCLTVRCRCISQSFTSTSVRRCQGNCPRLGPPIVVLEVFLGSSLYRLLKLRTRLGACRVADRDPSLRQTISPSSFVAWNSNGLQQRQQCEAGEQGRSCEDVDRLSARSEWTETLSKALHAAVDEMLAGDQPSQRQSSETLPPPKFVDAVTAAMGGELHQWRSAVMATVLGSEQQRD